MSKKINYDIEPVSFKIMKVLGVLAVIGLLVWWLWPEGWHQAESDEMDGTWNVVSGVIDTKGTLEIKNWEYKTHVETQGGGGLRFANLASSGKYIQQGDDYVFTDNGGVALNTFHVTITGNKKTMHFEERSKHFMIEFKREK